MNISIPDHPLLDAVVFFTIFPKPLGAVETPQGLQECLKPDFTAPLQTDEIVKNAIRDLLRFGGYKPAGRGKPSSEYLLRSFQENCFPNVNIAVDTGNIVSLYSGIPVSVIDFSKIQGPFSIDIGKKGEQYQFNRSGQSIDIYGLLCFYDISGACANPVKDSQRTKTDESTTQTVTVIWGAKAVADQVKKTFDWYTQLLSRSGAAIELISQNNQ